MGFRAGRVPGWKPELGCGDVGCLNPIWDSGGALVPTDQFRCAKRWMGLLHERREARGGRPGPVGASPGAGAKPEAPVCEEVGVLSAKPREFRSKMGQVGSRLGGTPICTQSRQGGMEGSIWF